jgi:hypothetical protein
VNGWAREKVLQYCCFDPQFVPQSASALKPPIVSDRVESLEKISGTNITVRKSAALLGIVAKKVRLPRFFEIY